MYQTQRDITLNLICYVEFTCIDPIEMLTFTRNISNITEAVSSSVHVNGKQIMPLYSLVSQSTRQAPWKKHCVYYILYTIYKRKKIYLLYFS